MAELQTIRVFYSRPEAVVAKSALEARGIFAVLPDDVHTANAWHHMFALQGIRLCALEPDVSAAADALEAMPGYEEPEYDGTILRALLAVLFFFTSGIPFPVLQRRTSDPDRSGKLGTVDS